MKQEIGDVKQMEKVFFCVCANKVCHVWFITSLSYVQFKALKIWLKEMKQEAFPHNNSSIYAEPP